MERIWSYCVHRYFQKCVKYRYSSAQQLKQHVKQFSTTQDLQLKQGTMQAWQIHRYGGNEELALSSNVRIPKIVNTNDVLVKIHAVSINPIDCKMRDGYGSTMLNALRQKSLMPANGRELPLILGRDFSGEVVKVGRGVKKFSRGDQVWGTVFATKQGCLAEYTVADASEISRKPQNITHTEAGSIPYVASTVNAALSTVGGLTEQNAFGKRILIHGGSGGIGTFAIQLMKAYGADVTTTCGTDAVELVTSLGADEVIDYKIQDVQKELSYLERFDIILDSFGKEKTGYSQAFLKSGINSRYVTLKHPFLGNFDDYGVPVGILKNVTDAMYDTLTGLQKGVSHRWAMYLPNGKALDKVARMVEDDQIIPVLDKVFPFEQVPEAFEKVEQGHGRGKTVIQIIKETVDSKNNG